jgi:phage gp36-like protein
MGDYTTEDKIWSLMPQLPLTSSSGYTTASTLAAQAISDAEAEINGYVAQRYSLPFTTVPVQIRSIANGLSVFYTYLYVYSADNINQNDFTDDPRYKIQLGKLKAIADGDIVLTMTNGSAVVQASSTSMVNSANKSYQPIFDLDTSTSWAIDSDRADEISNDRG